MSKITHTLTAAAVAVVALMATVSTALADTAVSSNWSGYVAHGSGVRFRSVQARWRQPRLTCSSRTDSYSAVWVGLGGYSRSSNALEQIGTEADCDVAGHTLTSVWYELLPAPTHAIGLTVWPGDLIAASVTVQGHRSTLALTDLTRHRSFRRTLYTGSVDVSSADWIVEAPSDCTSSCQTLPLARFGTVSFSNARAMATSRRAGSVVAHGWGATRIVMTVGGRRFVSGGVVEALPSGLGAAGTAFTDSYTASAAAQAGAATRQAAPRIGQLVHGRAKLGL